MKPTPISYSHAPDPVTPHEVHIAWLIEQNLELWDAIILLMQKVDILEAKLA